jgi:hypothetical protein
LFIIGQTIEGGALELMEDNGLKDTRDTSIKVVFQLMTVLGRRDCE